MYVCVCNGVTDREIRAEVEEGACSLEDLQDRLKVATCCGRCAECARGILNEARTESLTPLEIPEISLTPALA